MKWKVGDNCKIIKGQVVESGVITKVNDNVATVKLEAGFNYVAYLSELSPMDLKNVDNIVAGALYDFLGHLTTLQDDFRVGRHSEAGIILKELISFAEKRNLSLKNPFVNTWDTRIGKS